MRQTAIAIASLLLLLSSQAHAVNLTIERTSSVAAVPVADVDRGELAPPPGIEQAPTKPRPDYVVEGRYVSTSQRGRIPIPTPNPAAVSYCEVASFD